MNAPRFKPCGGGIAIMSGDTIALLIRRDELPELVLACATVLQNARDVPKRGE